MSESSRLATYFPELSGAIVDAIVYDEPLYRKTLDLGVTDKVGGGERFLYISLRSLGW